MIVRAPSDFAAASMARETLSGERSVTAQIVEPDPLKNAPSAPADSAAPITLSRNGMSFFAEGLVQAIDEGAAKFFVFARGKCGGDGAGVPAVFHCVQAIDPGGQDTTRVFCGDLEIRNQKHEV